MARSRHRARRERGAGARSPVEPRGPDLRRRRARRRAARGGPRSGDGSRRPRRRRRDQRVRAAAERALRRARHRPEGRSQHADRARRERRRQADHDHQPPDRRPGVRRPAGDALRLQPERVEPAARRGGRRAVQRADEGRLPLPQRGEPVRRLRPGEPARARAHPADDDGPRADRAVHRAARHRHRRSRDLPDGRARGPEQADRAVVGRAAVEPQALLPVRRRLRDRAPPARPGQRAAGAAARCGLRGRDLEPEHLRAKLQRRGQRRGGDDDQGDRRSSATGRCATRWATAARRPRCSSTCWPRTTRACSTASPPARSSRTTGPRCRARSTAAC